MAEIKAIISDVDRTLVRPGPDDLPSARVIEAVKRAQQVASFSLATARPLRLTRNVIKALGVSDLSVFDGGATIIHPQTEEVVREYALDVETQLKIAKVVGKYQVDVYFADNEERFNEDAVRARNQTIRTVEIEGAKLDQVATLLADLQVIDGISAHETTSWLPGEVRDIHINRADATKQHAVEELIKLLGVTKEQTMGIGDSPNDLPLFEAVGFRVALGDAPAQLKEQADFVAPTLAQDGAAIALDKFIK